MSSLRDDAKIAAATIRRKLLISKEKGVGVEVEI